MASSSASQASLAWREAQKIRKYLLRDIDKLQPSTGAGIDISRFESVDGFLEKFRLACVSTIFLDFDYAVSENAEEYLWIIHTSINTEYRRILGRLKQSSHAVERRKVEKMYNNFLRIAHKFYKGYIQRLSARYDIQELKRIAQGIEVEQLAVEDKISPVSIDLQRKVLSSCHLTLIHLGDLARYRAQARHKNAGYEAALAYYSLAHHLQPQSGFAFHQMGIVNLDQGNHLDVIYHFYRAWAVERPHPNAKPNLEAEFKTVQSPNSSKSRHGISTPQDPFATWFVKLHALFYKGEVFHQQDEMEGEVMHRLKMAGRTTTSVNTLLKMALVNMLAHDVATIKYTDIKDETASRFYQFTLRFNARFLQTFCTVLECEIEESISNAKDISGKPDSTDEISTVEALLPILRIYGMWLAARRHEVFGSAGSFGSIIPMMVQNLARVFTLLCVETYNQENLTTCPYLLPEDIEILGLRPLHDDQVPEACRFYCGEDGKSKPYLQAPEQLPSRRVERSGRVLDILRCAYFLAEDNAVPLTYKIENNSLVFQYQQDLHTGQLPFPMETEPVQIPTASNLSTGANLAQAGHPQIAEAISTSSEIKVSCIPEMDATHRTNGDLETSHETDDAEENLINMLAPFLRPPTPPTLQSRPRQDSSYGMHTATAAEVFTPLEVEPSPTGSIPSGKFEPLPWKWFNTPNPHNDENQVSSLGRDAFNSRRSLTHSPNVSVATGQPLEDPFATPGRQASTAFARNMASDIPSPLQIASGRTHRENLLHAFGDSTNAPRSSFGPWSQDTSLSGQPAPAASGRGHQGFGNIPISSGFTGFSHPSSLYQGTPANDGLYSRAFPAALDLGLSEEASRENGQPFGRHFQIDETASTYDEAILRAAYQARR